MEDGAWKKIFRIFRHCKSINEFRLDSCRLTDENCVEIISGIQKSYMKNSLNTMKWNGNGLISKESWRKIFELLVVMPLLLNIDLGYCGITNSKLEYITAVLVSENEKGNAFFKPKKISLYSNKDINVKSY